MSEKPSAANVLRNILSGMLDTAIKLRWRTDNPARLTETYEEGDGTKTWTEDDIAQYRETHALGTMARLTLELALNTAARKCNVSMLAAIQEAIDALAAASIKYLITTEYGKPFTVAGLGNRMRKWCDKAGLKDCSMHGLRKATSRRTAESGGTDAQG